MESNVNTKVITDFKTVSGHPMIVSKDSLDLAKMKMELQRNDVFTLEQFINHRLSQGTAKSQTPTCVLPSGIQKIDPKRNDPILNEVLERSASSARKAECDSGTQSLESGDVPSGTEQLPNSQVTSGWIINVGTDVELFQPDRQQLNLQEDTDAIVLAVTKLHAPIYYLPNKKCCVSEAALEKLKKKYPAAEGWDGYYVRATSFYGKQPGSLFKTRVIITDCHFKPDVRQGFWYRLDGFQQSLGNSAEFWSTPKSTMIPLPMRRIKNLIPHCETFENIQSYSREIFERFDVDIVARVVSIDERGSGQNVVLEDLNGSRMTLKFIFGIDVEGAGQFHKGSVVGMVGLEVRPPVTAKFGIVFTNSYSKFFVDPPFPNHLKESFGRFIAKRDGENAVPNVLKRPYSVLGEEDELERTHDEDI